MSTIQNSVMLIGHLGDNPEEVKLDSKKKLTTFSVATNLRYKNKEGEAVEKTQWHRIVAWNKLAEICLEHLKKAATSLVVDTWNIVNMKPSQVKKDELQKFI